MLALVCLLSISCTNETTDSEIIDETQKHLNVGTYTSFESDVLNLINVYRISKKIPPLIRLELVSSISKNHTLYMIKAQELSHDYFNKRYLELASKVQATLVGENVAVGYATAKGVVNGWIASDGHRAIIETEAFTHFGISIKSDKQGMNYFTNIFIKR